MNHFTEKVFRIIKKRGKTIVFPVLAALFLLFYAAPPLGIAEPHTPRLEKSLGEYDSFQPNGDISRFTGESLYFEIGFLWFDRAATAKVTFAQNGDQFTSVLEARTKGFVGFFTAYRRHIYKSTFKMINGGSRVRTEKFERTVIEGDKVEKSDHFFDYDSRIHSWIHYVNDDIVEKGQEEIPEGINFDDILAVFYNFRNEAYGPLEEGSRFVINTIPEKGHSNISVHIITGEEENKQRESEGRPLSDELLIHIIVPKEIFKTETGEMMVWGSKHYIPIETIVKDYILLGDLHAILTKREYMEPAPLSKPESSDWKFHE